MFAVLGLSRNVGNQLPISAA